MNKEIKEYIINNKDLLQSSGDFLLMLLNKYINVIEELELTNEQWFIDWEIEMNKLTVKDHNENKLPTL